MAYLEWSDSLSCGFREIDDDHQRLIGILNQLHDCISSEGGNDAVGDILEELLSYTAWHFRHEERLMQQYAYPDFPEHKQRHDDLTAEAKSLYEKFIAGDADVPAGLMPFLKEWLSEHIGIVDKKTGAFLAEKAG